MSELFQTSSEKIAIALMAADVHYRMDANYQSALKRSVFKPENLKRGTDRKSQITSENKLATNTAKSALTYIWRSSSHVTERALVISGYHQKAVRGHLTSRGLSKAFCTIGGVKDLDELSSIEQDIGRIVKAADVFGLIEYVNDPPNGNSKPFHGTSLLHRFLTELNSKNAILINDLSRDSRASLALQGGVL